MPNDSAAVNSERRSATSGPRRILSPPSSQYVELSKIGSGAYGLVMKGKNTKTGEVIALKRMVVRLSDGGIPQSILREIGLLRRMGDLEHPNIVRYGTAVDVWSFACIMAELYTLEPLFPGDSEIDQLKKIISVIGVPPAYDWPIDSYMSLNCFAGLSITSLSSILSNVNPVAIDLLKKTLTFNPHCRSSARELLFHPFFADVPP